MKNKTSKFEELTQYIDPISQFNRVGEELEVLSKESYHITNFQATVGGYSGGYYEITLNFNNRLLCWKHYGAGKEEMMEKTIRRKELEKFREGLESINLINWESKYVEPGICDGTQWSIELDIDGKKKKIIGDNKYPKEWSDFCELVRAVSGKKFK